MQRLPAERLAQNQVLAVFEASALSFKLPRTASKISPGAWLT